MNETIFALATAPGRAAVAVVRISGPGAAKALSDFGVTKPKPRQATLRPLRGLDGLLLDHALVLWFPGPASYTGEDCVELHLHGGVAVVDSVMTSLAASGLRLAGAGEFTRRAFEHGKLDLSQAEAIADLVDAETAGQARQAMAQLHGELGARYTVWRSDLVGILADLEAAVDFPDEEVPAEVAFRARGPLESIARDLNLAIEDGSRGRRIRQGYTVAIMGPPNAGKSSLFNKILQRDATIVTPVAGTTRDVVEAPLNLGPYRVILADMAGLHGTEDEVEAEGVRRARAWAASAALRLWVVDQSEASADWRDGVDLLRAGDLCVLNKCDLSCGRASVAVEAFAVEAHLDVLKVSLHFAGAEAVDRWLERRVERDLRGTDFPATTRLRHARHLEVARDHVVAALQVLHHPELASEDVRLACRSLEKVTGAIGADEVLDRVFQNFCIGK